jgi:hypothetical protein
MSSAIYNFLLYIYVHLHIGGKPQILGCRVSNSQEKCHSILAIIKTTFFSPRVSGELCYFPSSSTSIVGFQIHENNGTLSLQSTDILIFSQS